MSVALGQALGFLASIGVEVDRSQLSRWLAGRATTHADDLGLAFACARGNEVAARHFEKTWMPVAEKSLKKAGLDGTVTDDVLSWLRAELFARDQGPLFDTYTGRSDLGGWLRAIVVHEGVRRSKKQRREVTPEAIAEIPVPDIELTALRGAYGPQFTEAISNVFASLTVEQRNVLRQSFLDGLSIDVLAKLYGVHRATAARRVQAARQALVDGVRAHLKEQLKLGDSSIDELITLGNLNESLSGLLRKTRG